jgi:polysaccharide biosynthesis protein PslG
MLHKPIFVVVPALLAALALTLAGCSLARTNNANGQRPCARHGSAFARPCVTSSASTPPSAVKPMGVAEPDLVAKTPAAQASELAAMKAIGITSVRLDADWGGVQYAGRNSFSWTALDQVVASVRAAGMTVDLIIDGCPAWAAKAGTSGDVSPPPASPALYAVFAAAVATRYAPQGVTMFEIWNEPNNKGFWSPKPSPAAYTADLKAAYASIKRVDPAALILSAGLAPEVNDGTDINAITFLKSMYADGAKGSFDAVAYHPYSYPALPNSYQSWSGWSQMSQTNPSIRSVMISNGDAAKQIWITEVGAPSSGPDGVGQQGQAEDLTQAIANANATPWIAGLYLYSWQDEGTDPANDENWFGLVTAAGVHKTAYATVATALGH